MSIFLCCMVAPPLILCCSDGYFRLPIRGESRSNKGCRENPRRYRLCQNNDDSEGQKEPDPHKPYAPDPSRIGNPKRTQCNCQNQGQTQNNQDFLHALRHRFSPFLACCPSAYFFTATGSTPGSITSSSTFFSFFNAMVVVVPMKLKKRIAAGISCSRMM